VNDITALLEQAADGQAAARSRVMEALHLELRNIARQAMSDPRGRQVARPFFENITGFLPAGSRLQ